MVRAREVSKISPAIANLAARFSRGSAVVRAVKLSSSSVAACTNSRFRARDESYAS